MPNRILREGILTSERVNSLGATAEIFYRRLMSVVDDFGRYWAKPELLRAGLYPLKLDRVGNSDIGKWLLETEKAALVRTYTVAGKQYLELTDFRQQVRAKVSKFPAPAEHMRSICVAHAYVDVDGDGDGDGDGDDIARSASASSPAGQVNGEAVAHIPIIGNTEFGVTAAFLGELEAAYPLVDGPGTLREIRMWCLANPTKRKTQRGATRFINSWFERVQNKG